jgi:AhpD family alkylhydroperoxidase
METRDRRIRLALLAVGIPSLLTGLWIRLAPHDFWSNFPGFGAHWVRALGPYNGHALTDYGGALVGLSVGLVAVALLPRVRALPLMLSAWLLASVPHLLYHVVDTSSLSTTGYVLNTALLAGAVVIPAAILALDLRAKAPASPQAAGPAGENARIPLAPERGLLRRIAYQGSRREVGMVTTPIAVTAHNGAILAGYGAMELGFMKAKQLDERFKDLAATRAGMVVGCEYCLDIASAIARKSGVTDDELRELVDWRASELLSADDKLVLELADAMTRSPAVIEDELFDRLRSRFDEAQLVELVGTIAIENYRARFNWAFGIGSDGFSEGAYCVPPVPAGAAVADRQPVASPR